MRNALTICLSLVVALGAGCSDDAAVQHTQAVKALDKAVSLLDQANRGFPHANEFGEETFKIHDGDGQTYHWPDFDDQRMKLLDQVIDQLQSPQLRNASASLRQEIDRVLSQAHAAKADILYARATREQSRFAAASTALVAKSLAIDIVRERGSQFNVDYSVVLANYQDYQRDTRAEITDLDNANAAMKRKLDDLAKSMATANQRRDELMTRVQKLRDQAFTAKGDARFTLLDQATQLEVQANQALAEAQKLDATRDALASELEISQKRAELADKSADVIKEELANVSKTQSQSQQQRSAATSELERLAGELRQALEDASKSFTEQVHAPFDAAIAEMNKAVQAAQHLRRGGRADLLTRQVDLARMLAGRISAEGSFARTLSLVANVTGKEAGAGSVIKDKIDRLAKGQAESMTRAATVIKEAGDLARELAPKQPQSDEDRIPADQVDRLNQYRALILDSAIDQAAADKLDLPEINLLQAPAPETPAPAQPGQPAPGQPQPNAPAAGESSR